MWVILFNFNWRKNPQTHFQSEKSSIQNMNQLHVIFQRILTIRKYAQQSKYYEFAGKSHDQEKYSKENCVQNCKHVCPPRT